MNAVIFDLDGTLCDSAPDLHACTNAVLAKNNLDPLPLDIVRSFIGNGVPKLVERVMGVADIPFSNDRHAKLTAQFESFYSANPADKTVLYPGVLDVLNDLKSKGIPMGVCTNKVHNITLKVLKALGISNYFSSVIGGDSLPTHKPDPAMLFACINELGADNVAYVGDSEVDAATAVAAKTPFLLFSKGYRKSPVCEIPHDQVFANYSELPELLKIVGNFPG